MQPTAPRTSHFEIRWTAAICLYLVILHGAQKDPFKCCRQVQPGQPWFEGCLTGVGDCAHATRPDLGQGGAMAIEVRLFRPHSSLTALIPPQVPMADDKPLAK